MSGPIIIGVDPGLDGALARLFGHSLEIADMPTLEVRRGKRKAREIDADALAALIEQMAEPAAHVILEKQGAMPGQGVSSMFSLGNSFGTIRGIVAAYRLPRTIVPAGSWKRALGIGKGKDAARARASELLPGYAHFWRRVKDDGRAEASLLALYGRRQLGQEPAKRKAGAVDVGQGALL